VQSVISNQFYVTYLVYFMVVEERNDKINLLDLGQAELAELLGSWKQPAFRARQVYRQLYVNLASDFDAMTDLPAALRARLKDETRIGTLELRREQIADQGETRKTLWGIGGDTVIETVLMRYPDRATVCVSSQAGCGMGCVFCATGMMGLRRNISPGQIVEQVLHFERRLRRQRAEDDRGLDHVTNLVFMGMGEPFANYDRWWQAVERLHDPAGYNLGARNMTVSTVGLVPGINRLARERLPINLAVSLHAPNDELRSSLMPVNKRYPIDVLLQSVRDYTAATHRRVSFEYVLLQGQNDTPELAAELAGRINGMLCHVNLIPWNPVPGTPLERSHRRRVNAFQDELTKRGIGCTVRIERGVEIAAACGQLAAQPAASNVALIA
jgi:23S rRNA (adenine2503-C2)-methyltransferase